MIYQAIQTKFFGPNNSKGDRIKVSSQAKTKWVGWDYGLGIDENHRSAALELIQELGWVGENYGSPIGGCLKDGSYVWVLPPKE